MGWQWHQLDNMQTTCTSLQTYNHASISPHFLKAGCCSWRPTNSVKALKTSWHCKTKTKSSRSRSGPSTRPKPRPHFWFWDSFDTKTVVSWYYLETKTVVLNHIAGTHAQLLFKRQIFHAHSRSLSAVLNRSHKGNIKDAGVDFLHIESSTQNLEQWNYTSSNFI